MPSGPPRRHQTTTTTDPSRAADATGRRVAVVTGASGGIGRAVAQRLAGDGTSVLVHSSGNEARAAEVVEASLDDLDRMHRTTVRGTFVVSQQAVRRLRAGGRW